MSTVSPLIAVTFDPAAAFPDAIWLRNAAEAHDWASLRQFMDQVPQDSDRSFPLGVVGETKGVEGPLQELVSAYPQDTFFALLLAQRQVTMAWNARSNARAQHVSQKRFATFHQILRQAERLLIDVTARRPDDGMAWCLRLTTSMGLELGKGEARRRYEQLAKYHPHHFVAQARMLQLLCPKWSGSWEAAFSFARQCVHNAPPGGMHGALLAEAHLEQRLHLGNTKGTEYLQRPDVRADLVQAADRSVSHPEFRHTYEWVKVRGVFALAFAMAGDMERSAVQFRALDKLGTKYPWDYFGAPGEVYAHYRRLALRKG